MSWPVYPDQDNLSNYGVLSSRQFDAMMAANKLRSPVKSSKPSSIEKGRQMETLAWYTVVAVVASMIVYVVHPIKKLPTPPSLIVLAVVVTAPILALAILVIL